jgi:tetratricopeptide (TPR) repeat protein
VKGLEEVPRHQRNLIQKQIVQEQNRNMELVQQSETRKKNESSYYIKRGNVLSGLNRLEEALDSYGKAIETDINIATAYYHRGCVLVKLNRLDEALESYDKAIKIDPNHANSYYNREFLLKKFNRLDEALESYDKVIKEDPNYHCGFVL